MKEQKIKKIEELPSDIPKTKLLEWLACKPRAERISDEKWITDCYRWEIGTYGRIINTK